jgi:hypothetical protein
MKLTKESKQILNYLKTNTTQPAYNTHPHTLNIVHEVYDYILTASNYIAVEKKKAGKHFYNLSYEVIHTEKQIPKPKNFNYNSFPLQIREQINNASLNAMHYKFSLFERKINIIFVTETSAEHQISTFNKYVDTILTWLYILNEQASTHCSKVITIYLYFTSNQKRLPKTNIDVLDEINVNSAFTTTCPVNSEIVVFRKEEWLKVLIHETFHNFGLDFSDSNSNHCKKEIVKLFPVKSEVNLYESYTECWAEIINVSFCSFHLMKHVSFEHFMHEFNDLILYEVTYSFFQLTKTLDFMGLKYKDLYSNTSYSKISRETLYKENTHVLAYYVIKTVLLNNFQGFLNWCDKHNVSLMQFKKTPANEMEFCKFIKRNYKSASMINNVVIMDQLLQNNKKIENAFIMNNLRMTVCELG